MAKVLSLTTTVAALEAASEFIGPVNYEGKNRQQEWLLNRYEVYKNSVDGIPELESWAKQTAEEINEILESRGFKIRLDPWDKLEDKFGTLGILDYTLTWYRPASNSKILNDGYDAFTLNSSSIISSFEVEGHENPVIELRTQNSDIVKITKQNEPKDEFEAMEMVESLRRKSPKTSLGINEVTIPKVHYSQLTDMAWIIGLSSGPMSVAKALQEVRFGMNEIGARAKEATAITAIGSSLPPKPHPYIFDEPFLIWVERPDIDVPIFQAWIGKDDWKDPGDLQNI